MTFKIKQFTIGDNKVNAASAREIHKELGLKKDFSTWIKKELTLFKFGKDYTLYSKDKSLDLTLHFLEERLNSGFKVRVEYIVTLDVAKHLCMLQRNEKGMQARQYFIDAEKQSQTPRNYIESLKALVASEEARIEAEEKRDLLIHQGKRYVASELAGELGMKSAIKFNQMLKKDKIQYKVGNTWKLYAKYEALGYAEYKQIELDHGVIIYQMRWTGVGRDFILNRYKEQ